MLRAVVLDIYIDTTSTKDLAVAERRLDPDGNSYPLDLATIADLKSLRRRLLRSMAKAGRSAESTGGGNARKRTRIVISVDDWNTVGLADALASGDIPVTVAEAPTGS